MPARSLLPSPSRGGKASGAARSSGRSSGRSSRRRVAGHFSGSIWSYRSGVIDNSSVRGQRIVSRSAPAPRQHTAQGVFFVHGCGRLKGLQPKRQQLFYTARSSKRRHLSTRCVATMTTRGSLLGPPFGACAGGDRPADRVAGAVATAASSAVGGRRPGTAGWQGGASARSAAQHTPRGERFAAGFHPRVMRRGGARLVKSGYAACYALRGRSGSASRPWPALQQPITPPPRCSANLWPRPWHAGCSLV